MRKFGKFLLTCFLLFVAIYVFLILKKFCFLRIKISDDFYIQQKPFVDNYVLKKADKTKYIIIILFNPPNNAPKILFGTPIKAINLNNLSSTLNRVNTIFSINKTITNIRIKAIHS